MKLWKIGFLFLIAIALTACFSDYGAGTGTISINLGGSNARNATAITHPWPPIGDDGEYIIDLDFAITFTGNGEIITLNAKSGERIRTTVTAGRWNVEVKAYWQGMNGVNGNHYATGTATAVVMAGRDNTVHVQMEQAFGTHKEIIITGLQGLENPHLITEAVIEIGRVIFTDGETEWEQVAFGDSEFSNNSSVSFKLYSWVDDVKQPWTGSGAYSIAIYFYYSGTDTEELGFIYTDGRSWNEIGNALPTFNIQSPVSTIPFDKFIGGIDDYGGIEINPDPLEFAPVPVGYTPAPLTVTVTNRADAPAVVTIGLRGEYADKFTLSKDGFSIPPGGYDTFTITPVAGLPVGYYDAGLDIGAIYPYGMGVGMGIPFRFTVTDAAAYALGDTGPGGGIIFYHDPEGFTVEGYYGDTAYDFDTYTAHYLEAAPADMATTLAWASDGFYETDNPNTLTVIGLGRRNTALILVTDANAPASKACNELTTGGKTDWFLPSENELFELYRLYNSEGKGSYGNLSVNLPYWSSSHSPDNGYGHVFAWYVYFLDGTQGWDGQKNIPHNVRAIRAF